ncbi:MAG: phage tail protein [Spirochaetales bacterium]|nr:phage tail protein [Spirochaetales bacterium]
MSDRQENGPYAGFNFLVEIDDIGDAAFSECIGLTTETEPIEYREGADDITVRKIPGLKRFTDITLKRGMTNNFTDLWDWRKKVLMGMTKRASGSITLLNEARDPVMRWEFTDGWPLKWEGPSLNATSNEIAIETLVIAHEGLDMMAVVGEE